MDACEGEQERERGSERERKRGCAHVGLAVYGCLGVGACVIMWNGASDTSEFERNSADVWAINDYW